VFLPNNFCPSFGAIFTIEGLAHLVSSVQLMTSSLDFVNRFIKA
jgi:hypothetical protein